MGGALGGVWLKMGDRLMAYLSDHTLIAPYPNSINKIHNTIEFTVDALLRCGVKPEKIYKYLWGWKSR